MTMVEPIPQDYSQRWSLLLNSFLLQITHVLALCNWIIISIYIIIFNRKSIWIEISPCMSKSWRCHILMSFGLVTYTPGIEWVNSAVSLHYEGRIVAEPQMRSRNPCTPISLPPQISSYRWINCYKNTQNKTKNNDWIFFFNLMHCVFR